MILEIDVGNTRIKWRLREKGNMIDRGAIEASALEPLCKALAHKQLRAVLVASVVTTFNDTLSELCQRYFQLRPDFAVVQAEQCGVINGYRNVQQMGVDRWLGVLAAHGRYGTSLIVSCGSALTVDLVLSEGRHLGGYIGPGLQLMRKSLYRDTDRVKVDALDYQVSLEPGRSTEEAVSSALASMTLGLVHQGLASIKAQTDDLINIVVSGGDGEWLTQKLKEIIGGESVVFVPELVLDGLSLMFDDMARA